MYLKLYSNIPEFISKITVATLLVIFELHPRKVCEMFVYKHTETIKC